MLLAIDEDPATSTCTRASFSLVLLLAGRSRDLLSLEGTFAHFCTSECKSSESSLVASSLGFAKPPFKDCSKPPRTQFKRNLFRPRETSRMA